MKTSRILAGLAALLSGSLLGNGCLDNFWKGIFAKGFIDNKMVDIFTDWLNEDLFS